MTTLTRESAAAGRDVGGGIVAEQYHALVHWILSSDDPGAVEAKTIGITSCPRGAGASTVAANLSVAAAQVCDRPVLLLDLSSMRSVLAMRMSVSGELDLPEATAADSYPGQHVTASPIPNLSLLTVNEAGAPETFSTDGCKLNDLLRELERDFGFIVVDLPPTDSGLCFAIGRLLNGVLLVVEAERTDGDAAVRAKQRLIRANTAVLGVILNKYSGDLPNWFAAKR